MRQNKPTYEDLEAQIAELKQDHAEQLKQLIKNSFDIIVLLDGEGNQHYVSDSCKRILGFNPEELINICVIDEMIHPEDRQKTLTGLQDIIHNSAHGGVQYRHRHKDGSWVFLEAYGTNQLNNPLIKSVVLNVRDISERKKAEQALKESEARLSKLNATKDRFLSIIGHDLRNPFNSITGFSELLFDKIEQKDFEGLKEYAGIIYNSSLLVNDLLTNLLTWSRAQSGRIEYCPEKINLSELVDEITLLLNETAREKSITISKDLPCDTIILADRNMISTILRNLISNGIKFTTDGGEIGIRAEQLEDNIIISVADSGIGLEQDAIDKLFRIECTQSTRGTNGEKGTGLGLLLCKEFIDTHGGEIWAENNQNKGSSFHFTLPQAIQEPAAF